MEVLIYSPKSSPRLTYVCQVIFTEWYGLSYQITSDVPFFQQYKAPKLQYSSDSICVDIPWMFACDLLFETGLQSSRPTCEKTQKEQPLVFPSPKKGDWRNDIFATVFYFLSRYEEYQPFKADAHGRFPASASLAEQHHFLDTPIVDYWVQNLIDRLQQAFPRLQPTKTRFEVALSYDIDQIWAYRHRSWRGYASALRDLLKGKFSALQQRWRVWRKQEVDPFYTFDRLDQLHQQYGLSPIYFWLLADPGPFDRNASPLLTEVQDLILKIAVHYPIGIHPSYRSNEDQQALQQEIKRLQDIAKKEIRHARQHFLRLHLPATYRRLLAEGIRHDYSMGFADQVGFRAGTCRSFPWYDLEKEETTPLWIHPFCAMDVSLRQYQKRSPVEAKQMLFQLLTHCRNVNGPYRLLWHNSSFSEQHDWAGWGQMYEEVVKRAVEIKGTDRRA